MIDRRKQKRDRRRIYSTLRDRSSLDEGRIGVIRLQPSSAAPNKSNLFDIASTVTLLCICIITNQISYDICTVNAFSTFRPGSITSALSSSSESRKASPTALFMFSFRNDNIMEDNDSDYSNGNGTTDIMESTKETKVDDVEDFSAWMEGLKLGTPLGKMASSIPTIKSNEYESEPDKKLKLDSNVNPATAKSYRKTTTTESTKELKVDDVDDFSAWMEGLKLGTPLGKMASSVPTIISDEYESEPDKNSKLDSNVSPATAKGSDSKNVRGLKTETDEPIMNISLEDTGRRKTNPLSNLIQFEAMLELTKIYGNKDENVKSSSDSAATDIFAVVDRLVKTFQKEANEQEKERTEMLQLAQLEEQIIAEEKLAKYDSETEENMDTVNTNVKEISSYTTVKDLMDVGGLPLPKVSNIWDTFSGKADSVGPTEDDIREVDTNSKDIEEDTIPLSQSSTASASSSPLFRVTQGPKEADTTSSSANIAQAAESILKETTNKMEYLVAEASNVFLDPYAQGTINATSSSAGAFGDLVGQASNVINNAAISQKTLPATTTGTLVESISNDIVAAAQKIAKESGVDINVQFAADRAREATEFAVGVAGTANMVLDAGYAYGSRSGAAGMSGRDDDINYLAASAATQTAESVFSPDGTNQATSAHQQPLFGDFASAQRIEPHEYGNVVYQGAEMGVLAGAIYENMMPRCHKLGHSFVANGTTANVAWMVTDSVMDREVYTAAFCHHDDDVLESGDDSKFTSSGPVMIRTITMRGFDASDESVDREALLNEICLGTAEPMDDATADLVLFHKGLLNIARQIYADTKKYIDWTSPSHKIVLNGHSIGGSLSVLMLLLIASERGGEYKMEWLKSIVSSVQYFLFLTNHD